MRHCLQVWLSTVPIGNKGGQGGERHYDISDLVPKAHTPTTRRAGHTFVVCQCLTGEPYLTAALRKDLEAGELGAGGDLR